MSTTDTCLGLVRNRRDSVEQTSHDVKPGQHSSSGKVPASKGGELADEARASGGKRKRGDALTEAEKRTKQQQAAARAEARTEARAEANHRWLIGIDFGTTYSGIAWVLKSDSSGNVQVVKDWKGQDGVQEKVPTRIAYASGNDFTGDRSRFGYDVEAKHSSVSFFKLGLDGNTRKSDFDDPLLDSAVGQSLMRLAPGKTYQDQAEDFLRYLFEYTLTSLTKFGNEAVHATPIDFYVTVPALWSLAAKEATKQAASKAGFGSRSGDSLSLLPEPEAAAICAIKDHIEQFKSKSAIQVGNTVVIADLGGGTCDVISYTVKQIRGKLKLEEACIGDGAKCGGTTIDRNLHEFMGQRFGAAFTGLAPKITSAGSAFMDAFERAKRGFDLEVPDKVIELPSKLGLNEIQIEESWYNFELDCVLITANELAVMFDQVIPRALQIVENQIVSIKEAQKPAPKAIILCGGLGSSKYVQHKFRQWCEAELGGRIQVICPRNPWSAIARGAALYAMDKAVVFRRSRDFIGVLVHKEFVEGEHEEADAHHCPILHQKRAMRQMSWIVQRGDKIEEKTRFAIECFATLKKGDWEAQRILKQGLYSCNARTGPRRFDASVSKIGEIIIDLTVSAVDILNRKKKAPSDDGHSILIPVTIYVTPGSDTGTLQVSAKSRNIEVGSARVEYEADPAWEGTLTT